MGGGALRTRRWVPHRKSPLSRSIPREFLGKVDGFYVYRVDGSRVRDTLDVDFTSGGNAGRYLYVPEGQIWIDDGLTEEDVAPTILHEYRETLLMRRGIPYDEAHEVSAEVESRFRRSRVYEGMNPIQEVKRYLRRRLGSQELLPDSFVLTLGGTILPTTWFGHERAIDQWNEKHPDDELDYAVRNCVCVGRSPQQGFVNIYTNQPYLTRRQVRVLSLYAEQLPPSIRVELSIGKWGALLPTGEKLEEWLEEYQAA